MANAISDDVIIGGGGGLEPDDVWWRRGEGESKMAYKLMT